MAERNKGIRSKLGKALKHAGVIARCKAIEFWSGGREARAFLAAQFYREHGHAIRPREWVEQLPGHAQFLADVRTTAEAMGIDPPVVVVLAGYNAFVSSAGVLTRDLMVVNEEVFFRYSPEQLKAVAAHELAHIANGDVDEVSFNFLNRRAFNHRQEYDADALAASVTGDPDSLASVLGQSRNAADHCHPSSRQRIRKLLERPAKTHSERLAERAEEEVPGRGR
jgi:Zn-dependent protease with chaperone function